MKKVLFVNRDGPIITKRAVYTLSLEELEFCPKVIVNLHRIANDLNYELVMLIHGDDSTSDPFAEESFWLMQNKVLNIMKNEGIFFSDILINRTSLSERISSQISINQLFQSYLSKEYDIQNSCLVGNCQKDLDIANQIHTKVILVSNQLNQDANLTTSNWEEIYRFLAFPSRIGEVNRKTSETDISIHLDLDGKGEADINTGIGFFDHILSQIVKHSGCDLTVQVSGDLHVDEHHTIEDTALALGEAFDKALGDKRGVERYGFVLPMDDALAQVAVDFSGRNWIEWEVEFKREKIGEMPTEMFYHFFKSFTDTAKCNLYVQARGNNEHHKIEAISKALGKAIGQAIQRSASNQNIPSTKGVL